jgi:excisionase family DNA binding protein
MAVTETPRLLTVNEAAARLRVHHRTIRRAIRDGELRAVRVRRAVRIQEEALERYLEKNDQPAEEVNRGANS